MNFNGSILGKCGAGAGVGAAGARTFSRRRSPQDVLLGAGVGVGGKMLSRSRSWSRSRQKNSRLRIPASYKQIIRKFWRIKFSGKILVVLWWISPKVKNLWNVICLSSTTKFDCPSIFGKSTCIGELNDSGRNKNERWVTVMLQCEGIIWNQKRSHESNIHKKSRGDRTMRLRYLQWAEAWPWPSRSASQEP